MATLNERDSKRIVELLEKGEVAKLIIDAAKDIGWFATAIGSQLVKTIR